MAFAPWSIGDFGQNPIQGFTIILKTVIETDRIHREAKITTVRQKSNRTRGVFSGFHFYAITYRLFNRYFFVAVIITAQDASQIKFIE